MEWETKIPEIISRKLAGDDVTEWEQAVFDDWLTASEAHEAMYRRMLSGESLATYRAILDKSDIPAGISAVEKRIKTPVIRRRIAAITAVAAALAAVVVLTVRDLPWTSPPTTSSIPEVRDSHPALVAEDKKVVLSMGEEHIELSKDDDETAWRQQVAALPVEPKADDAPDIVKIAVSRGMTYRLRLPDSTQVWLNAETTIEFPEKFTAATRNVTVSGEAYFEVAHHPERPFVITSNLLKITVLGTKFVVNSYADAGKSFVTLVAGSLKVSNDADSRILKPNEQAVYDKKAGGLAVTEVDDIRTFTAWMNGQFYYRSSPPDVLFSALERWYDVDFVFEESDLSAMGKITMMFSRKDDLTSVLESLCALTGWQYRIDNRSIYMSKK
ncbi:MAG: FecR domain-containing protein [Dysgonamonadaceae bacterium]|jgi:ferric-dicitrate binding protein FerR (iron transport regulator)|nr:FecR domain-containing protein [Dysgonamonadaceae bacterium]